MNDDVPFEDIKSQIDENYKNFTESKKGLLKLVSNYLVLLKKKNMNHCLEIQKILSLFKMQCLLQQMKLEEHLIHLE